MLMPKRTKFRRPHRVKYDGKAKGAKVILMAHLGRPKGEKNPEFTLAPVAKYMSNLLGEEVMFIPDVADAPKMVEELKDYL